MGGRGERLQDANIIKELLVDVDVETKNQIVIFHQKNNHMCVCVCSYRFSDKLS